MAVRKKAVVQPTEQRNGPSEGSTSSSGCQDEELDPDEELQLRRLVTAAVRESVTKEWMKGILAFAAVIAGAFLCTWDSKTEDFAYWFIHISGLVVFCVGLALAVEFIKLLIGGDLTKATVALMKGFAMKEWMKVFLAFVSTLGGVTLCIVGFIDSRTRFGQFDLNDYDVMGIIFGIVLMAGGITFFWTQSKFYKD